MQHLRKITVKSCQTTLQMKSTRLDNTLPQQSKEQSKNGEKGHQSLEDLFDLGGKISKKVDTKIGRDGKNSTKIAFDAKSIETPLEIYSAMTLKYFQSGTKRLKMKEDEDEDIQIGNRQMCINNKSLVLRLYSAYGSHCVIDDLGDQTITSFKPIDSLLQIVNLYSRIISR